ncbi:MAG: SH3 domain-containing protein [Thermoflexales bacterium]|nr:SH3 domain-containing protein [Thermoflexales bacterium]
MGSLRLLLRALLVAVVAALAGGLAHSARAQPPGQNLLVNPNFDWPAQTNGDVCAIGWQKDNAITPHGWIAYWTCKNSEEQNQDQINRAPEFRVMTVDIAAYRVRSYPTSASFFNFWSLNRSAGLYQMVSGIRPGTRLRFSFWANLLTTNSSELPLSSSRQPGGLQVRACIQTLGRVIFRPDVNDPTTVCGAWIRPYDTWGEAWVEATAAAETIAVVIDSTAEYPVVHNDVYVDDASLVVVGSAPPTPTPLPASAAPAAPAGNTPAVVVKMPTANVRAAPSFSAAILASVPQGSTFPVRAYTPDRQWWQIEYGGQLAFMHQSVVDLNPAAQAALGIQGNNAPTPTPALPTPAPATPSQPPQVVANTGSARLNLRAAPRPDARIVAKVPNGTPLDVLGRSADRKWWRVSYPSAPGGVVWVMAQYVLPNAAAEQVPPGQ